MAFHVSREKYGHKIWQIVFTKYSLPPSDPLLLQCEDSLQICMHDGRYLIVEAEILVYLISFSNLEGAVEYEN